MPRVRCVEIIQASPRRTFDVFSDFGNAAANVKGITRMEWLTEGPVGVGSRFMETRVMFGKQATETMEVTQWNPDAETPSYSLGCSSCGMRIDTTFRFEPIDNGRATQVLMDINCIPVSFFAKLMSPLSRLMMGPMKKCVTSDIADLRCVLESNGS